MPFQKGSGLKEHTSFANLLFVNSLVEITKDKFYSQFFYITLSS